MRVRMIEATPDPEKTICRAARNDYMSRYGADMDFEDIMATVGGETIEEKKKTLIGHLLKHGHFGPFEHVNATFHVKGISRSCMSQITRHRHATFDIQSLRYVPFDHYDEEDVRTGEAVVHIPELDDPGICGRQAEFTDEWKEMEDEDVLDARNRIYQRSMTQSFEDYNDLLALGVAPENARMVLPLGTRINMVVTLNARMLMHIGDMRGAADSQWEIREMTEQILDLAAEWCPTTFGYYNENLKGRKNRLAP